MLVLFLSMSLLGLFLWSYDDCFEKHNADVLRISRTVFYMALFFGFLYGVSNFGKFPLDKRVRAWYNKGIKGKGISKCF